MGSEVRNGYSGGFCLDAERQERRLQLVLAYLHAELGRLCATKSFVWITTILATISFTSSFLICKFGLAHFESTDQATLIALFSGASWMPYVGAFFGCISVTGEFSTGISRLIYGASPHRWVGGIAKQLMICAVCVMLVVEALVFSFLGAVCVSGLTTGKLLATSVFLCSFIGSLVVTSILGTIGVALGFIAKQSQEGILLLIVLLIVAPIIVAELARHVELGNVLGVLLPLAAANNIVDPLSEFNIVNLITLASWAGVSVAATVVALNRAEL